MSDIESLFKPPVTVLVAGVAVEIRELTVRQLPPFLRAAAPVLNAMAAPGGFDLGGVMAHTDAIVAAVQVATGVDPEWLATLPATELLTLLEGVVEANVDFFGQALPSFMARLTGRGAVG